MAARGFIRVTCRKPSRSRLNASSGVMPCNSSQRNKQPSPQPIAL
nr:MAG TPA: hypothetical protein [Bacteriophage sp.]